MQDAENGPVPENAEIIRDLPNENFMLVKDAAKALDMSELHIRRAFDAGHFPGIKLGRLYRVSRPFVNALVTEVNAGRRIVVEEFAATWVAAKAVA